MKIEKEGIHIYLKEEYVENTYFISMEYPLMKNNAIPSLLPLEFREQDGESSLYYEITGKESLEEIGQKKQFGYAEIKGLLQGFFNLFHELEDYMLSLKQVSFCKESIFMDFKNRVYWAYGPKVHEDVQSNIEAIFLWLLSLVDPDDTLALGLAHRVYSASKQGGITREFVEHCLKGQGNNSSPKKEVEIIEEIDQMDWKKQNLGEVMDSKEVALPDPLKKKVKEVEVKKDEKLSKEKNATGILILKILLLVLNLVLMGYWFYFINRYGMQRMILGFMAVTLLVLSMIAGSLLRDFLKKRMRKIDFAENLIQSKDVPTSNLSSKSIFEELDEYWEKGQEIMVESEYLRQEEPYLYNTNTSKMERMKVFPFYIGSEEGLNQLPLSHKTVSRQHAVIMKKQDDQFYVEDLESIHGTWVNGKKILPGTPVCLHSGDRISFGKESFQYCLE